MHIRYGPAMTAALEHDRLGQWVVLSQLHISRSVQGAARPPRQKQEGPLPPGSPACDVGSRVARDVSKSTAGAHHAAADAIMLYERQNGERCSDGISRSDNCRMRHGHGTSGPSNRRTIAGPEDRLRPSQGQVSRPRDRISAWFWQTGGVLDGRDAPARSESLRICPPARQDEAFGSPDRWSGG